MNPHTWKCEDWLYRTDTLLLKSYPSPTLAPPNVMYISNTIVVFVLKKICSKFRSSMILLLGEYLRRTQPCWRTQGMVSVSKGLSLVKWSFSPLPEYPGGNVKPLECPTWEDCPCWLGVLGSGYIICVNTWLWWCLVPGAWYQLDLWRGSRIRSDKKAVGHAYVTNSHQK